MFKGLGDMGKLMQQAQEMQQKMADAQEALNDIEVEGVAAAGMVKVTSTAKGDVTKVSIDPSMMTPDDREVLEDLLVAAIKDARMKGAEKAQEEMGKITEGLPLPPGMKLPF